MKLFDSIKINKSMFVLLMTLVSSLIIFPSIFYVKDYYGKYEMITIGIAWFIISVLLIWEFRIFGVFISILFLFLLTILFTSIKLFVIKVDWSIYISITILLVICYSMIANNTRKIKVNILKGHSHLKAFEEAFQQNIKTNFDLLLLMVIPFISQFILGNTQSVAISALFIICLTSNYLINLFLKKLIINLLIVTTWINIDKIFNFSKREFKIFSKNRDLTIVGKYFMIFLVELVVGGIVGASITSSLKMGVVHDYDDALYFKNLSLVWLTSTFLVLFYVIFRYGWTYALSLSINIFISSAFVILLLASSQIKVNDYILLVTSIGMSIVIKSNAHKYYEIKIIRDNHIGELDKQALITIYNKINKKVFAQNLFDSFLVLAFLIYPLFFNQEFWFIISLLISIYTFLAINLILSPFLWIKLELFKINFLHKRQKTNYWDFEEKEEQIVKGINDLKI